MYVIALYNPVEDILPDIFEEEGKTKYFKSHNEAREYLYNLYSMNSVHIKPLEEDNLILMGVQ